jgi:hypothetical protein
LCSSTELSKAYVTNSKRIYNPTDGLYFYTDFGSDNSLVKSGITAWNVCPEIEFTEEVTLAGGTDIAIEYVDLDYNDSYGTSYGSGNIAIYKPWKSLSNTRKKETIVHEVGHELGLAHCQSSKESISVMRATGFNDKAYPLSDDKEGISYLY